MSLRVLTAADVRQALPMDEAIAAMRTAFAQLSGGTAQMPLRSRIAMENGTALFMPAHLPASANLAVKIVTVFPGNVARDLPLIHALVLALDSDTGRPLALLEGHTLTAIRTGAGSGAATAALARPDASSVAIIGSGVQARTQLEAVCTVRPIAKVWVYSPTREHAQRFAAAMAGRGPIPAAIHVAQNADEAVAQADIVCAATTASTPVFDGRLLKPGAHVNGVGAYAPTMQELDATTIQRALVVVDSKTAVLAEAGDLIVPLAQGVIDENHLYAELGEILNGQKAGRTSVDQITLFKSVGVAVQDAAAAGVALRNAMRDDLGTMINL